MLATEQIVHKLKVQTPDPVLVNQYLKTIAKAYNVQWDGGQSDSLIEYAMNSWPTAVSSHY